MSISPDKEKALETAMAQVERQFGKGSIMKLGSQPVIRVPVISTGSIALDKALGIGGLPRGRIVEIFGPESSGKTTLALHVIANAHRVFLPDRGHLHHRLLDLGLSHRTSVLVLYVAVVILAMAALAIVVVNSVQNSARIISQAV